MFVDQTCGRSLSIPRSSLDPQQHRFPVLKLPILPSVTSLAAMAFWQTTMNSSFLDPDDPVDQYIVQDSDDRPKPCPTCQERCDPATGVYFHPSCVISYQSSGMLLYCCPMCDFLDADMSHLQDHFRERHVIPAFICRSPKCGVKTEDLFDMRRHIQESHMHPETCTIADADKIRCNRRFPSKGHFLHHYYTVHQPKRFTSKAWYSNLIVNSDRECRRKRPSHSPANPSPASSRSCPDAGPQPDLPDAIVERSINLYSEREYYDVTRFPPQKCHDCDVEFYDPVSFAIHYPCITQEQGSNGQPYFKCPQNTCFGVTFEQIQDLQDHYVEH